jgi:hypothetical protein
MPRTLILFTLLLACSACGASRVHRIGEAEYKGGGSPDSIRLFLGDVTRPYQEIAWVDSFSSVDRDREVKREQLGELRRRAAELGADAIIEIQSLKEQRRGMTPDPRTPFPAFQPADYELRFLRGKAVRFVATEADPVLEREEERAGMELAPATAEGPTGESAIDRIPDGPSPEGPTGQEAVQRPGY